MPLSAKYCSRKLAFSLPVVASVKVVLLLKNLTDILITALLITFQFVS